jgi:hypothetical protein
MAKDLVIKVKIDGQEIDIAKKTTKELTQQISDLRTKLEGVPLGSKDFKKISGDINTLEGGFKKAKSAQQDFLTNLSELPGIAGLAGQSIKGIKQGFDLLASNPLIAVFSLLAAVMLKVIDKMKNMEAVMDPLEKISSIFSGVMETLANVILPPVAYILEKIAEGAAFLGDVFSKLIGATNDVGDNMSYVADTMDQLADTNAAFSLSQAESNRKLQEAREIASDATKTIGVRIQALKDAAALERKISAEARARETAAARAKAVELATTLGYNQQQIDAIKKYDAAKLKSFAMEIQGQKGLNREKSDALFQSLGVIEDSAAQESKIAKKTQTAITGLEKEEKAKRVEDGKKAAEQTKDFLSRLATFENDTRLNGIKDEQEKARVSLEIEKDKTLKEIAALEMSTKRKNALRLAAIKDFASKEKVLTDKQNDDNAKKVQTFNDKIAQLQIDQYADELQKQKLSIDLKAIQDKRAMTEDDTFKKYSKENQAKVLAMIDKKAQVDKEKADEDAAKKNADLIYKQIEFERQSREMSIQTRLQEIDNEIKSEIEKIGERRKLLDEQAGIDRDKEIENLDKLLKAKEITNEDYLKRKAELEKKYNVTITKNAIDTELKLINARKANIDAVNTLANSVGALAQAMGAETAEGKALIKVQQALALASTAAALALAFQGLGKDLAKGFPTNIIAVASTLALVATAISQFKALTGPVGGTEAAAGPAQNLTGYYADGGMIGGRRHAQGGTLIEAEAGEAIMTRNAVTMFAPLLSTLNQAGGGTAFSPNAMVSSYDNPKSSNDTSITPIIKTYVVSSDMTSSQEKNARLKNLSVL